MLKLDSFVQSLINESILEVLYDKEKQKSYPFQRILYTYPTIFMVQYSLAQVLIKNDIEPKYVLGLSLGEYIGSAVADVMSYKELLKCLIKQVQLFEANCQKGGMIAVIDEASLYEQIPILNRNSELVSINYKSYFVVFGRDEDIEEISKYLKSKGILHQKFPVCFGFHSSLKGKEPIPNI